jgi:glycosyltransferase involved in cell wall biosynthesis
MERYAREVSIQLGRRGWRSLLSFLNQPEGEVREFLSLPNVVMEPLPSLARQSWDAARQLHALQSRYRPEIVHLQFTPFLSPLPWVAKLGGASKVFFTDQGSHPEAARPARASLWKRAAGRLLTAPYTKVVSVSEFNRRMMAERGFLPSGRACCIPNSVEVAVRQDAAAGLAFRRRFGIPADRVLVVQVSWIIPEKGILDLLAAARLAIAVEPSLHLALVGDGAYRAQYEQRAAEMGIAGHVSWTGLIRDPYGEGVFDAADIVCQMSRWEEAFGFVIAEAMAFEKPLLATRAGGIPEVVAEGETGYLVERGDAEAAAGRLIELSRDPSLRRRMGQAGARRVRQQFDLRDKVTQVLALYDEQFSAPGDR